MKLKHIYAPNRSVYFSLEKDGTCLFCTLKNCDISQDRENLIIHRGKKCYVMLNKFPYNNGHSMVVPYSHATFLNEIDNKTIEEIYRYLKIIETTLIEDYKADGVNIGLNIREAAGAGVIDHLHYHILPRWAGDSNFMTSISNTRVIPEDFNITYNRIKKGFCSI